MSKVSQLELKTALQQFVTGHVAAAGVMAEEEAQRLATLSMEQSRAEYESLCAVWEANPHREGLELLAQRRIEELLELRRRLNLASHLEVA